MYMPAVSKAQARLFKLVHLHQQGKLSRPNKRIKSLAKSMSPEDVLHYAKTKLKGLPEHISDNLKVALYQGFMKRAADVRPPIPVSNPQPNITNLGKGIFHANAGVLPNAVYRHLPSFSGNAKFPINPNRSMLNIDSHGGGNRNNYSLSNPHSEDNKGAYYDLSIPNIVHEGAPWGGKTESLVYQPKRTPENIGKDIKQFVGLPSSAAESDGRTDSEEIYNSKLLTNQHLTSELQDKNPGIIKALGCNHDANGCTPDMYAKFIKQLNTTINGRHQYGDGSFANNGKNEITHNQDPITNRDYPFKDNYTPTTYSTPKDFKVNVNKVIMTPPGNYSWNIGDSSPILTDTLNKLKLPIAAPHEYNLIPGSDPTAQKSWLNDGVYTDARRVGIPEGVAAAAAAGGRAAAVAAGARFTGVPPLVAANLIAQMAGEAGEIGQELGKGNNYLDKMQAVNTNPYTSYKDKVMANMSRPMGSIASFIKEKEELQQLMLDNLKDKIFNR